jgi:hypothetical protein
VPDYQPDKSAIVVKLHHSFTDGLGFSAFLLGIAGEESADALPALKPMPLWTRILIWLSYPYILVMYNIKASKGGKDFNPIQT